MPPTPPLCSVAEALSIIARHVRVLPVARVALQEAAGFTLAECVRTDIDSPPFDKARMDGFAVRSADCQGTAVSLRVLGSIPAGRNPDRPITTGEAIRINTGAPMPSGADAVLPIEDAAVSTDGSTVTTAATLRPGQHVARRGSEIHKGDEVVPAGVRLGSAHIAALAAAGAARISVHRRPRLSVLVTGDELVSADQSPSTAQIRDANGPCLAALALEAGCEPANLGIVGDDPALLLERVNQALLADVVCISGGVSMGEHDYVPSVLEEAGVQLHLRKLAMKPGKPTVFGTGPTGQAVFGVPGNPVSAFVCFALLIRGALAAMRGRECRMPPLMPATLEQAIGPAGDRMEFLPARLKTGPTGLSVSPVRWQGSGDVFGLARCNALIVREPGTPAREPGKPVDVLLLDEVC